MHAVGKHATPRGATFICFAALGGGGARYRILAEACVYGDVFCATCTMRVDLALPSWTGWLCAATRCARFVSNSTSALFAADSARMLRCSSIGLAPLRIRLNVVPRCHKKQRIRTLTMHRARVTRVTRCSPEAE